MALFPRATPQGRIFPHLAQIPYPKAASGKLQDTTSFRPANEIPKGA